VEPAPADEPKAEAGAPIASDAVAATDVPEKSEATPVAEIEGTTP
jgi:hypothetical protein